MLMTLPRSTALLALLLAGLLGACERNPRPALPSTLPAVATLNGEPVSRALLDHLTRVQTDAANPHGAPASAAAATATPAVDRKQLLDELIDIELLAQKARQRGLDKSPAVAAEIELQSKTLLAQLVMRELIGSTQISDAELQAAYDELVPPHEFQLRHVQLADREAALATISQLQQGQRFTELARRLSTDTASRAQGGRLGWMMVEQMPGDFAAAVRVLKPGEHTVQPVRTNQGWHVIQLEARRPHAKRPSLQTTATWLHPQLVHAKVQAEQHRWREQTQIQVSTDSALPAGMVAVVNGQPVQRTVLDLLAKARQGDAPADAPQDRARLLDDLVMTELMSQRAHATGLAARIDTQAELELAHKSLLGQHLMKQLVSEVKVSDEALQTRYQETQPELEITASHILLGDETVARQVITELDAGASFAALAHKHTADEYTRDKGGRLGSVKAGDLEPAFVAAARSLKPGGITPAPVRTPHGWHVIQLHTMRSLDKEPFEAMKAALHSQLVNERVQAQVAQWRKEARLDMLQAP